MTSEIKGIVYKGFEEHSIEEVGVSNVDEPICFYLLDEDGDYCSIVVAQNFWGGFYFKYVWTAIKHRGQGFASTLMNEALSYAKENKYPFATVTTMSFQAPEFYKKFGFVEEFCREGYSNGTSVHYLRKDL